jgi:hypothetical protein
MTERFRFKGSLDTTMTREKVRKLIEQMLAFGEQQQKVHITLQISEDKYYQNIQNLKKKKAT